MRRITTGWLAALVALSSAGSLLAHHSLANYDTTTAVRVKGTIFQFEQINPHSIIFLDEQGAGGQKIRWAIQGPSVAQLIRTNFAKDALKAGDVVEVCGYVPKERTIWQVANRETAGVVQSPSGQLINAEVLVMPDGKERSWGDYGFHKCFPPGYTDGHNSK